MSALEQAGLRLLHRFDPETAHGLALRALQLGLSPTTGTVTSTRLRTSLAGLTLPRPWALPPGLTRTQPPSDPVPRRVRLYRGRRRNPAGRNAAIPNPACFA